MYCPLENYQSNGDTIKIYVSSFPFLPHEQERFNGCSESCSVHTSHVHIATHRQFRVDEWKLRQYRRSGGSGTANGLMKLSYESFFNEDKINHTTRLMHIKQATYALSQWKDYTEETGGGMDSSLTNQITVPDVWLEYQTRLRFGSVKPRAAKVQQLLCYVVYRMNTGCNQNNNTWKKIT